MLFMLITLGFVVVVTGCMILINRWMVSQRRRDSQEPKPEPRLKTNHRKRIVQ